MQHDQRESYLFKKVIPFDAKEVININDLLRALKNCSFQGRNLGIALDILYKMVTDKKCLTILTLSGAMVPAGMGELINLLLENKLVDVLVTTGANITHDFVDYAVNVGHYIGSPYVDDDELYKFKINRIYDTFLPEENYEKAEEMLLRIMDDSFTSKNIEMAPSDFLKIIGENLENRCILSTAAKNDIKVFVPALSDSEFALDLIRYT
ncbi:MAG: deoxyhypusine synthase family protein, partial [Candidatus Hodarchaeota archaeon]